MNWLAVVVLLASLTTIPAFAQKADFALAERYSADSLNRYVNRLSVSPNWLDKSSSFYYSISGTNGQHYFLVDAMKGRRSLLFTTGDLAEPLTKLTGEPVDAADLRIYGLSLDSSNPGEVVFQHKGNRYSYHTKSKVLQALIKEDRPRPARRPASPEPYWKKFSPDSVWFAYAYKHNLYLHKRDESKPTQLSADGEPFYSFISSSSSSTDDKKYSSVAYWLKGSKTLLALREDKRLVGEMSIINSLAKPRPELSTYKFPVPGDKHVVGYELFFINTVDRSMKKLDIAKYPDQKIILQSTLVNGRTWLQADNITESEYVYFLRRARTNDRMDLCRLDIHTGEVVEIISETCKPHFNDQLFICKVLNNGEDILWWSERTGYGQYYLYNKDGELKNTLTKGNFVAGDIHSIDTAGRSLIFEGYGREKDINPYYRMYYKVNFDGSRFTLLTPGNGYHDINLSPDRKYLVDTYSRVDAAPVNILRNMAGKQILQLESEDLSDLLATGWKFPEPIKLKAADGKTDLYGVVYKPFNMDSSRKYPVISNVYPGPQDDYIPRRFTIDDNYNQSLAQLGFIVVNVAYRGSSPLRGREFHGFSYGNLRDYALADDKHVLQELAKERPYMDLSRVGIYGHSGGGFMSATAILSDPDFYKVAVAASGNYDSNIYTQWWGETYHGVWLKEKKLKDSTSYAFESNIPSTTELAGNLKGKLFLITGDVDRNVHPAHTFRLADALIKANKRFDMMVLPGKDHGLGDKYYINLIRYYFIEHLLKEENNDIDIVNHK